MSELLAPWFLHPAAWPLLLSGPALFLALVWMGHARRQRLERILGQRGRRLVQATPGLEPRLAGLCATLLALAWMGPSLRDSAIEEGGAQGDLVFVVDVSRSMLAQDQSPNRLSLARRTIQEFSTKQPDHRYGLVAFAGEARLLCPLTEDAHAFQSLVAQLEPYVVGVGGTDLSTALQVAAPLLDDDESIEQVRPRAIVLVTDAGSASEISATAEWLRSRRVGADVPIHVFGLGTERGAKIPTTPPSETPFVLDENGDEVIVRLNSDGLREVAALGNGRYTDFRLSDDPLEALEPLRSSSAAILDTRDDQRDRRRDSAFQWTLVAALVSGLLSTILRSSPSKTGGAG